ncbi:MAG: hypothetical protein PHY54_10410 [Methylococcales bacterium]|nr:hypothetical protein [Methylococcales bacterium]
MTFLTHAISKNSNYSVPNAKNPQSGLKKMYINPNEIKRPRPATTDRRRIAGIAGGSSAPVIRQTALRLKRSAGAVEGNIAE